MTLKKCRECRGEISDQAESCPHCGKPQKTFSKPQEIEQTGKFWKSIKALAVVLWWGGFIMAFKYFGWGILLMLFGLSIGLSAKIGAWWNNG